MSDMEKVAEWESLWRIVHDTHDVDAVLKLIGAERIMGNDCRKMIRDISEIKVADLEARLDLLNQETMNAFDQLRSEATKDAGIAECSMLAKAAHEIADGKDVLIPPAVDLEFMDSERVAQADADRVHTMHESVSALVRECAEKLRVNTERIEAAQGKAVEDPALNKMLAELYAKRREAVLAGEDTSKFDEQIVKLKGRMDALAVSQKLASDDVELLRWNDENLHARLNRLKAVEGRLARMDAAFQAHAMVAVLNSKIGELHDLVGHFSELREAAGAVSTPCAYEGHDRMIWPIFRGYWLRPDNHGHFIKAELETELARIF